MEIYLRNYNIFCLRRNKTAVGRSGLKTLDSILFHSFWMLNHISIFSIRKIKVKTLTEFHTYVIKQCMSPIGWRDEWLLGPYPHNQVTDWFGQGLCHLTDDLDFTLENQRAVRELQGQEAGWFSILAEIQNYLRELIKNTNSRTPTQTYWTRTSGVQPRNQCFFLHAIQVILTVDQIKEPLIWHKPSGIYEF